MVQRTDPDTIQRRMSAKQKRTKAAELRVQGRTWQQIADEVGYADPGTACRAVKEYLSKYPSPDVEELRAIENQKLDRLEQAALAILERFHVTVSQGRVMQVPKKPLEFLRDPDTGEIVHNQKTGFPLYVMEDLRDDGPENHAIQTLLRVMDRRAKLNGLDAPVRVQVDDGSMDSEIVELVEQMTRAGAPSIPEGHSG